MNDQEKAINFLLTLQRNSTPVRPFVYGITDKQYNIVKVYQNPIDALNFLTNNTSDEDIDLYPYLPCLIQIPYKYNSKEANELINHHPDALDATEFLTKLDKDNKNISMDLNDLRKKRLEMLQGFRHYIKKHSKKQKRLLQQTKIRYFIIGSLLTIILVLYPCLALVSLLPKHQLGLNLALTYALIAYCAICFGMMDLHYHWWKQIKSWFKAKKKGILFL